LTGLSTEETLKALRLLLNTKSILLYDEKGQLMEEEL
jgi:hypothetical protein